MIFILKYSLRVISSILMFDITTSIIKKIRVCLKKKQFQTFFQCNNKTINNNIYFETVSGNVATLRRLCDDTVRHVASLLNLRIDEI